jgi:hypothetical protein
MNMRKGNPLFLENNVVMEFHISRKARDLYQFDDSLFSLSGNVVFLNFHAARVFAHKMNERRDLVSFPERAVKAGQINAMGLIDEILHYIVSLYRDEKNLQVMKQALNYLYERFGKSAAMGPYGNLQRNFPWWPSIEVKWNSMPTSMVKQQGYLIVKSCWRR